MRKRTVALLLALGLAGVGAGFAGGLLTRPEPVVRPVATPLAAASPSVPIPTESDTEKPDVDFPSLATDLTYRTQQIGDDQFGWMYDVPVGWRSGQLAPNELTWSVPANPRGSFGMRVELVVDDHRPARDHVERKLADLQALDYDDLEVLVRTPDTLSITYVSGEGWRRYNTFRWFTAPGYPNAGLEFSVNGRSQDRPGLDDLLAKVSASARPVGG